MIVLLLMAVLMLTGISAEAGHLEDIVMQMVRPDCVVLIDSLKNIAPALAADWGI